MTKLEYNTNKILDAIDFDCEIRRYYELPDEYTELIDTFTYKELEDACEGTDIEPAALELKFWQVSVSGDDVAEKSELERELAKYEFDEIDVKKDELYRHHKHGLVRAIRQSHGKADSWVFSKNLDSAFDKNASALENMVVINVSDLSEDY